MPEPADNGLPPAGDNLPPAKAPEVIDWRGAWGDDVKGHPSMEKFKDSASLAKSYIELESNLGKDKVVIPGENATKEQWDAYHKAGGRPDAVDGYKFDDVSIPDSMKPYYSETEIASFKQKAHELGISTKQAQQLLEWNVTMNATNMTKLQNEQEAAFDTSTAQLKEEWMGDYEANKGLATRAFKTFGGEEGAEFLNKYGNDPIVLKTFARIGKAISEDMISGEPPSVIPSPAAAQAEIDSIMGNSEGPYYKADHPEHAALLKRVENLFSVVARAAS